MSRILALAACAVITASLAAAATGQPPLERFTISVLVRVMEGYVLCDYNVTVPNPGEFTCPFPYASSVIYVGGRSGCKATLEGGTIRIEAWERSASFVIALHPPMEVKRRELLMRVPVLLSFREGCSEARVTIKLGTTEFTASAEYPMLVRGSTATMNITDVSPGSVTEIKLRIAKTWGSWLVVRSLRRSVDISGYETATVRDAYEIENVGLRREGSVRIKLPPNATVLSVEGGVFKYSEGFGVGKYSVVVGSSYTEVVVTFVAPPAPGERAQLKVTYRVPLLRVDSEYSVSALWNPGLVVLNGTAEVRVLGEAAFKRPAPEATYRAGEYLVARFRVKPEESLPGLDSVVVELRVNTAASLWRQARPYVIAAAALAIALSSGFLVRSRLVRGAARRGRAPELARLMAEYVESLEEERDARLELARGRISRGVYRHRVEVSRVKRRKLRRAMEEAGRGLGADVRKALDEFFKLEGELRRLLPRLSRARGEEALPRVNELIDKMREIAEGLR